jgi:hypothetical protein
MPADPHLTRRQLLGAGTAATSAALVAWALRPLVRTAAAEEVAAPAVRGREEWAAGLAPTGPLEPEPDVRFLLVHHSASANGYGADAVAAEIRSFYRLHTAKGWPDVAYNFFVDRFGGIWEARQGSLAGPVKGDATGGSQGHALLCCFIGDHRTSPLTPEAEAAMVELLAFLARRHGIDPLAKVSFVSRGSNRWPAGTEVTTDTIAAHREMSRTACPGDAGYAFVKGPLPQRVAERLGGPSPTTLTSTPASTTAPPPSTTTTVPAPTTATTTTTVPAPSTTATTGPPTTSARVAQAAPADSDGGSENERWVVLGTVGATVAAALVWFRRPRG